MSHLEIEKRYLCRGLDIIKTLKKEHISYIILNLEQFYLKATKEETLRYRKDGNKYIKNIKKGRGLVREEFEVEASKKEYKRAKAKNSGGIIKKKRYKFKIDNNLYELDIFKGKLEGLSILEVEFKDIYQANEFEVNKLLTENIIKDITNEALYSNGALSRSMKIPLREDSFLSLKELKYAELKKAKFDLYISDYENAKYALSNTITRLFEAFEINFSEFLDSNSIKNIKRANRALVRIKNLINGYKSYIKKSNYLEILFNINNILLIFEEALVCNKNFKLLLKNKHKLPLNKQTKALKKLIKLAQKEKVALGNIREQKENIKKLETTLKNIAFKKQIEKPFSYLKDKILKHKRKSLKKEISGYGIEELYSNLLNYRNLQKYFSKQADLSKEFKKVKKLLFIDRCLSSVGSFKKECKSKITLKKLSKKIKKSL